MALGKYTIHPLNENTYAIEEKTPVSQGLCYLLCGEDTALLIDTALGFKGLREAVNSLTQLPVIAANTHAHADHIGGNHFFREIWHHGADKSLFTLHADPAYTAGIACEGVPKPLAAVMRGLLKPFLRISAAGDYHYFEHGHIFNLGGREIEVVHTPGHSAGSVCFLDRQARMIFTGDTLCEWGILLHLAGSCPPADFLASMERLQGLAGAYDTIWPGHHSFPVARAYLDDYIACEQEIADGTAPLHRDRGRLCAKYGKVLITLKDAG